MHRTWGRDHDVAGLVPPGATRIPEMKSFRRTTLLVAILVPVLLAPAVVRAQDPLGLKDPVDDFPAIEPAFTLKGHEKYARGVAFSPDGSKIASAGEDTAI